MLARNFATTGSPPFLCNKEKTKTEPAVTVNGEFARIERGISDPQGSWNGGVPQSDPPQNPESMAHHGSEIVLLGAPMGARLVFADLTTGFHIE